MRRALLIALSVLIAAGATGGQQTTPSAPATPEQAPPVRVKVYAVGPDVTAPELLSPDQVPITTEKCKRKVDGEVTISVLIDAAGKPHIIWFIHPSDTALDQTASDIVDADRFKPATHDGVPVAVSQSVEVDLQSCVEETKDDAGKKAYRLMLRSQPVQKFGTAPQSSQQSAYLSEMRYWTISGEGAPEVYRVGGAVTAPAPINFPAAEFSDEARRAGYQGICLITLVVDAQGMPQDVHVTRALGMGLDEKAMESVRKYRFKPAMKDGKTPVPAVVTVEVNFRLYK